jgi:hypothetical protein
MAEAEALAGAGGRAVAAAGLATAALERMYAAKARGTMRARGADCTTR